MSEQVSDTTLNDTGIFAPADFPDASEDSLYDLSLSYEQSYSTAISNSLIKHITEIKEKEERNIPNLQTSWKKKFREFLSTKNNKLLDFISSKMKSHPVLGAAEIFLQRFGKKNINFNTQNIREVILDISNNVDPIDELNALCISHEFLPIKQHMEQSKFLMDQYKLVAEKIIDKENLLSIKLTSLDTMHAKINGILTLSRNEHYNSLMETVEKYLEKVFEENSIESDYNEIIENYRKFIHLREIMRNIRFTESYEKEPLCTICFDNKITHAFVPCGHTFCINCVKKQSVSCSICRANVRDRIKLYFS